MGVSLAGKHTNCLTYFSIPRYLSQQELGVWCVDGGGCGHEGLRNGVPKNGLAHAKSIPLEIALDFIMTVQKMNNPHMTDILVGGCGQTDEITGFKKIG